MESSSESAKKKLMYSVCETPPWRLSLLLGLQHYLTQFGSTLMVPLLIADAICAGHNAMVKNYLISSTMLLCGLATFLQCSVGVRLPMMLGANFVYVIPVYSMMSMPEWQCQAVSVANGTNGTYVESDSRWPDRLQEIMGAVIIASVFQIVAGLFGIVGFISSRVGPVVFATIIISLGFAILPPAVRLSSACWPISILTIVLVSVFWMYLADVKVPFLSCTCSKKGCQPNVARIPLFSSFPIFLAMIISWLLCVVLTVTNTFSPVPGGFGHRARTDLDRNSVSDSSWIRIPYPFQWGLPTVSTTASIGMIVGMISTIIDSISDYYATARASSVNTPPSSAVNRGIFLEGLMTLLAGLLGTGAGTATYTENVAIVVITQVASIRVVQISGLIAIFLAVFGKFAALFATIPDPVIGGILLILFGVITSLGLQVLQFVDLKLMRNTFAVAVPFHLGLASMFYIVTSKSDDLSTGHDLLDQLIRTVFGNNVVFAFILSLIFDVTLPGTDEERGLLRWRENVIGDAESSEATEISGERKQTSVEKSNSSPALDGLHTQVEATANPYELPYIMPFLKRHKIFSKIPISPTYKARYAAHLINGCKRATVCCSVNHAELHEAIKELP